MAETKDAPPAETKALDRPERQENLNELRAQIAGQWDTAEELIQSARRERIAESTSAALKSEDGDATAELELEDIQSEYDGTDDAVEDATVVGAVVRGSGPKQVVSYVVEHPDGRITKHTCDVPGKVAEGRAQRKQDRTVRETAGSTAAKEPAKS